MRHANPGWVLCTIIAACIGIIESARAQDVLYTWSQGGWNGGGEVTGSFIINDNFPTVDGLTGANALVSFQAQWSGNLYSQPYAWTLADIQRAPSYITWGIPNNVLLDMQIEPGVGPVVYDPFDFPAVIADYRPGSIDPPGQSEPYIYSTEGLTSSIVVLPEPGVARMFLLVALPVLLLRRWRRFFGQNQM